MKWVQKTAIVLLLLWGIPISVLATVDALNPESKNRQGAVAALMLFGLPPIALGGWLLHNLRQRHQTALKQADLAREQLFLQLLHEHQGVINPILFATRAQLPLAEAKTYLDSKAIQLNANYVATEEGGIDYHFPL